MRIGVIGAGAQASVRVEALRRLAAEGRAAFAGWYEKADALTACGASSELGGFLDGLDAAFLAVAGGGHAGVAEAAAKRGVHVFLEWPPAVSVRECVALVRLAEEAGVEIGVSRPLRFHPLLERLPADWNPSLVLLRHEGEAEDAGAWGRRLADAVDLCCALARSSSVQRIDAEAVRGAAARPEALAFGLRFHNGAYAQAILRTGVAVPGSMLFVAGTGLQLEADLDGTFLYETDGRAAENVADARAFVPLAPERPSGLDAETRAFVEAVAARRAPPVTLLDGLHTLRLVERLMSRLR